MPYIDDSDFTKNLDDNMKVWRYVNFTKFVDLLEKQKQYFVSAHTLQNTSDPYEGYFQKANLVQLDKLDEYDKQMIEKRDIQARYEDPKSVFINCWHINEIDSDAMWKIYATMDTGIAIQTTIKKLKKSFHNHPQRIYFRKVKYVDNKKGDVKISWIPHRFSFKGKSFEHEQELRVFIEGTDQTTECIASDDGQFYRYYYIPPNRQTAIEKNKNGIYAKIDLDYFIEKIYVAPLAKSWFFTLVKAVTKKYGLRQNVIQSNFLDKPTI